MVYTISNYKECFSRVYEDLKIYGETSINYEGFIIHIEVGVPNSVSSYSTAIMKNNYEGTECTIFVGELCLEDKDYTESLICHEIGHAVHGDMRPDLTKPLENARLNNLYAEEEYMAWKYASKQLGLNIVIKAIQKLAVYSLHNHPDSPYPSVELINYAKLLEKGFTPTTTYKKSVLI